jgi:phosphate starvation-inducible protein PhoH
MIDSLYGISGIGVAILDNSDIVRNPIIGKILERLDDLEALKYNESKKS